MDLPQPDRSDQALPFRPHEIQGVVLSDEEWNAVTRILQELSAELSTLRSFTTTDREPAGAYDASLP